MARTPIDTRSPKEAWDEQYRLLAEEPLHWALQADELTAAFDVLTADIQANLRSPRRGARTTSVALMLAGFAIENLMKGLLVRGQTPLSEDGKFQLRSHDLFKLSSDAGLSLSDAEARLLERVQEFLMWAGRYPIPLTVDNMRPRTLAGGGFAPLTYHTIDDLTEVRGLIVKLRALLPKVEYRESGV